MEMPMPEGAVARALFPTGLIQPSGCYRFGMDALLLAAFATRILKEGVAKRRGTMSPATIAEFGCGCGAALLAVCLAHSGLRAVGIEREWPLLEACRDNINLLGLKEQATILRANLGLEKPPLANMALIMANPPWRKAGEGRASPAAMREKALCGDGLRDFCVAASMALRHLGGLCLIIPPDKLPDLCRIASETRLGVRRILPVASFAERDAIRVLCLCRKNAASRPRILPALILREQKEQGSRWRGEALLFCPWLDGKIKGN